MRFEVHVERQRYNHRVRFTTIFFDLDDTLYPSSSGLWPALKDRMTRYMIERVGIPAADVPRLRETYFRKYGTTLRGLQANHKLDVNDYLAYVHDVRLTDYIRPDPEQQSVLAALSTRNLIFTNADANHARRVLRTLRIEEHFVDVVDINRMDPYCKPSPEAFVVGDARGGRERPGAVRDDRRPAAHSRGRRGPSACTRSCWVRHRPAQMPTRPSATGGPYRPCSTAGTDEQSRRRWPCC